jgi:cobalt-zinc-cadmium resistance protein CzcA
MQEVLAQNDPSQAAEHLRDEEQRRLLQMREIVVASVNNVPIRVGDLVDGGPADSPGEDGGQPGIDVGHQTRLGKVSLSRPRRDADGNLLTDRSGNVLWDDQEEAVMGVVLMRKNEETLPALKGVHAKLDELNNNPGRLLPGVQLVPHFDQTSLIHVTTETVRENLLIGMVLVAVILLMFLSNVRSAIIVAINIPLALLFAFSVLYLRGKSANLLSIGAVDFGIIVDSSVIMVENIYRHISAGENIELPLRERIVHASQEVEKGLFFSTAIMVCAFIPLFTMQGPEGQIFGPMADTYAFALGGALLLALTLSPVLCLLLFRHLAPSRDNFLVRWLKRSYLRRLEWCLRHRLLTLAGFGVLIAITVAVFPLLGQDFMPELEEGNLYVRGTFPVNISLEAAADHARQARAIMRSFPEVQLVQSQVGRPDDGTDPTGYYNVEFTIPLRPEKEWPATREQSAWLRWLRKSRARTKPELINEMKAALSRQLPGVDWNFSQYIRDNVMESLSGVKGDNSVKIIGPDLDELERLARQVRERLEEKKEDGQPVIRGLEDVGIFRIKGQPNLELAVGPRQVQTVGSERGRRRKRHPQCGGGPGLHPDDRRGKNLRYHAALAGAAAQQRGGDSQYPCGYHQQYRHPRLRAELGPDDHDGTGGRALDHRQRPGHARSLR